MPDVKLIHGDCLDILPTLTEQVDAIITDVPYGSTACKWDIIIPFEPMWEQVKRVLKPRGVFVTTASQPFTSLLICSNLEWFKYEWIWNKVHAVGFQISKFRPMMQHENVIIFSPTTCLYNPIMTPRKKIKHRKSFSAGPSAPLSHHDGKDRIYTDYHPKSIIKISNADHTNRLHPTQKPVALYEYLIRTYTNEGDTVLDIAAGSGTTGEAAIKTNRNCILIEREEEYFSIAQRRVKDALQQPGLFA